MKRILVVEDTVYIKDEIVDILTIEDYDVYKAENGKQGIKAAKKHLLDLIISDILMPVADGFKLFSRLKKNKKTENIPVLFLSGKADKVDVKEGLALGAADYLVKPISPDDLMNTVKAII